MQQPFNDNAIYHTTYEDYGKDWLVSNGKTLEELGEDEIKLQYLEKCYKSKRRAEKLSNQHFYEIINYKCNFGENWVFYFFYKCTILQQKFLDLFSFFIFSLHSLHMNSIIFNSSIVLSFNSSTH